MSIYSPTVAPNSGEAFGRALQQSVGAFLQARQQKMQDEAEMLGRGYVPVTGTPAQPQPQQQGVPSSALSPAPVAPAVDQSAISRLGGASATPVQAPVGPAQPFNRGAVTPADQITPQGAAFSRMLGAQATPLQVAQPTPQNGVPSSALAKAAGLDTYASPTAGAITPAPVHLLGRDWQMTPAALASMQMQMATARATLDKTQSDTAKNIREISKPQPGDPGYIQYNAGLKGAEAAATVPYEIDKAVGLAKGTAAFERTPEKFIVNGQPMQGLVDKLGNYYDTYGRPVQGQVTPFVDPTATSLREIALNDRENNMQTRNEARLVQQYREATGKYSQTADALQAIGENRAGALKGDPVAQQTLLQDFIKLNLPGQQVTEGELGHYMYLMGLGEKGQQMLDKLRQGTPLGKQQVQLILSHADNLAAERMKGADYLRQQFVERGRRANVPDSAFPDWFGFLPGRSGASGGSSGDINLGHVQTIDEMIKAGYSDAQIKAALAGKAP